MLDEPALWLEAVKAAIWLPAAALLELMEPLPPLPKFWCTLPIIDIELLKPKTKQKFYFQNLQLIGMWLKEGRVVLKPRYLIPWLKNFGYQ